MNRSKNNQFLLILLGLNMVSLYLWFRFIRARLPREIPFPHLSFYGMIILFFICSILIYSLFTTYLKNKNTDKNIIYEFMLEPLKELDKYVKKYISPEILFLKILNKNPLRINLLINLFGLFPKIVISLVLLIEIFYFHYLSLLYKVILLGLFVLLEKYIFFSLTKYKENLINDIENKIYIYLEYKYVIEMLEIFPDIKERYYDEEEEDYIIDEITIVPLQEFISYQEIKFIECGNFIKNRVVTSGKGFGEYKKLHNIPIDDNDFNHQLNFSNELKLQLNNILDLQIIEYNYNKTNNKNFYKNIKTFLIFLTLISWLYILIISLPNLYLDPFFYSLWETSFRQNPFE